MNVGFVSRVEYSVQGSELEAYKVVIEKTGESLNAFCTCPAGRNGQYCKHIFRLLSGNPESVVEGDLSLLSAVVDWISDTDVARALRNLSDAEDGLASAKKALAHAKKGLAHALRV